MGGCFGFCTVQSCTIPGSEIDGVWLFVLNTELATLCTQMQRGHHAQMPINTHGSKDWQQIVVLYVKFIHDDCKDVT